MCMFQFLNLLFIMMKWSSNLRLSKLPEKVTNSCLYFFSVDSNDTLYGSDPKFMAEVDGISNTLVDEILGHLQNPQPNQVPIVKLTWLMGWY